MIFFIRQCWMSVGKTRIPRKDRIADAGDRYVRPDLGREFLPSGALLLAAIERVSTHAPEAALYGKEGQTGDMLLPL